MSSKVCSKCGIEKELNSENWYKKSSSKDGYQSQCKQCKRNVDKQYHSDNKDRINEASRQYRSENKDKIAKYKKQYRSDNKDKIAKYSYEYYHSDHGKKVRKLNRNRRRARVYSLPNTLKDNEYNSTFNYFKKSCAYCGNKLTDDNHHIEHIVPLSKDTEYGTVKKNIIPACASCNQSKSDSLLASWYLSQPFYSFKRMLKIYEITSEDKEWIIYT